jgi:prolyl-tRNA editing enzyme YbaK/EbsC (Cys-tRNA(Pro) deacylase)
MPAKRIKMNKSNLLSKSAQSIQSELANKGLNCKVIEFSDSTKTAVDAAAAIGCSVAQIVKSLIFKAKSSHKPILILASGQNRVSEKLVESYIGQEIEKANADFVKEVTGFAIGGIPPVGHKQKIELIFIDEDLLQFNEVWAAAGTPYASFNIQSRDLLAITQGKIIAIK